MKQRTPYHSLLVDIRRERWWVRYHIGRNIGVRVAHVNDPATGGVITLPPHTAENLMHDRLVFPRIIAWVETGEQLNVDGGLEESTTTCRAYYIGYIRHADIGSVQWFLIRHFYPLFPFWI
jgi:hypothetical protein